jgi:2-dehydro-3-deoxy-D-arabinonate dehydratase
MRLFNTTDGLLVEHDGGWARLDSSSWDEVVNRDDLFDWLQHTAGSSPKLDAAPDLSRVLAPIGSQEVWAAGVTYFRSRTARMEESKSAGGGDFYDRVYAAERPELFFKATPHRVRGHGDPVRIRRDARWNVPEPELTLVITSGGSIVGYTIGNDMSSRDIEGENPLYLPQAKVYDGSCAIGPAVFVTKAPLAPTVEIRIAITRAGLVVFAGSTTLAAMKRTPEDLVSYLYRETSFASGCLLLTGTGIVPPDDFTLAAGDEIAIGIDHIGTLVNRVA